MTASLFATQEALYGALSADSNLQTLLGAPARIYDVVPPSAVFPYVTLGDLTLRDYDTKEATGFEQICIFHIWSRYRGRKELKQIMQGLYDVLHRATLTLTGASASSCQFQSASTNVESDGLTLHGTMRFRLLTHH